MMFMFVLTDIHRSSRWICITISVVPEALLDLWFAM
jgi:hypothetical protein